MNQGADRASGVKRVAVMGCVLVVLAGLLSGCATRSGRIKKNQALFDQFPQEIQAKVSEGVIEPGFTQDMVFLARGKPQRQYLRMTEEGSSEVWAWTRSEIKRERQKVRARFRIRDSNGSSRYVTDNVWVDVENRNEYEELRVEFTGNIVTAVEHASR